MIIGQTWVKVTTLNGAVTQKVGRGYVSLAYAATTPTIEDKFTLKDADTELWPAVDTKNVWLKSSKGDVSVAVEELT